MGTKKREKKRSLTPDIDKAELVSLMLKSIHGKKKNKGRE